MAIHRFYMLYKGLAETLGEAEAAGLFPEYATLPDKMSGAEQISLARKLMDRMDKTLDEETIRNIRQARSCNLSKQKIAEFDDLKI